MSSSGGAGVPAGAGAGTSTRVEQRTRKPWWLWLALALVALALLTLGLTQCGGPDTDAGTGGAAPSAAPGGAPAADASGLAAPAAGAGAAAGAAGGAAVGAVAPDALTVDGAPMLPLTQVAGADGALTGLVGKPVSAQGMSVQSVPADEGFWVGTSDTDRVWVQLTGTDESGYVVKPGDRVQFTGSVVNHDAGFAGQAGVDPAEGADQLTTQAAHVEVQKSALRQAS